MRPALTVARRLADQDLPVSVIAGEVAFQRGASTKHNCRVVTTDDGRPREDLLAHQRQVGARSRQRPRPSVCTIVADSTSQDWPSRSFEGVKHQPRPRVAAVAGTGWADRLALEHVMAG